MSGFENPYRLEVQTARLLHQTTRFSFFWANWNSPIPAFSIFILPVSYLCGVSPLKKPKEGVSKVGLALKILTDWKYSLQG